MMKIILKKKKKNKKNTTKKQTRGKTATGRGGKWK